ncbi:MAG: FkbM family methyltransferase [Verrucomicrobia bacterium]|nr:FkbM family methyltransferase [Verrucomicrobiota bacterium]
MNSQTPFTKHVLAQGCLSAEEFFLLDVGASGGIQPHWNVFQPYLKATGFDPLVTEVERLNRIETNPRVRYEDGFVGSGMPTQPLDKIAARNNGSFQRTSAVRATGLMNLNYQQQVFNSGAEMVWSKKQLTVDGWLPESNRRAVDFIKIDTDGSDYPVLVGARQTLAAGGVLGLTVECPFLGPIDDEANLFGNIDRLLRNQGFTLFNLDVYRYSRADLPRPFLYDIPAQTTHGAVQWGEALYFQDLGDADFERMWPREFSPIKKLKLACLFEIFDLPDCAIELLKKFRSELAPLIDFDYCLDALTPELAGEKLSYQHYNKVFDAAIKEGKLFHFGRERLASTQPSFASPAPAEANPEMLRLRHTLGRMLNRPEPVSESEVENATAALNALFASRDISAEIQKHGTRGQPALVPMLLYHLASARRERNEELAEVLEIIYSRLAAPARLATHREDNLATASAA